MRLLEFGYSIDITGNCQTIGGNQPDNMMPLTIMETGPYWHIGFSSTAGHPAGHTSAKTDWVIRN